VSLGAFTMQPASAPDEVAHLDLNDLLFGGPRVCWLDDGRICHIIWIRKRVRPVWHGDAPIATCAALTGDAAAKLVAAG
jgi:hypothetical protein